YGGVVASYTLPKNTDEEKAARTVAIQRALRTATDVPLAVMRLSVRALEAAGAVAAHGNRNAASDVGVAIALLHTGLDGARLNVNANLGGIKEAAYSKSVAEEIDRLVAQATASYKDANQKLTLG